MKDEIRFSLKTYDYVINKKTNEIILKEKCENPFDWANRVAAEAWLDRDVNCYQFGRCSIAFDREGHVGKAVCNPSDVWDSNAGIAIAYSRLKGLPINPYYLPNVPKEKPKSNKRKQLRVYKSGMRVCDIFDKEKGTVVSDTSRADTLVHIRWDNPKTRKFQYVVRKSIMLVEED